MTDISRDRKPTMGLAIGLLCCTLLLGACGGGGGDTTAGVFDQVSAQQARERAALLQARALNADAVGRVKNERSGEQPR